MFNKLNCVPLIWFGDMWVFDKPDWKRQSRFMSFCPPTYRSCGLGFFIAAINHSKLYKEIKCIALLKIDIYIQINLVNFPSLGKKNIHKISRKTWIFIDICIKNDVYIVIRLEHLHLNVKLKNSCVILSPEHHTTSNYASLRIRALWGNKSVFFLHDTWSRDL